jgi:D-glycero-D-manno-heptose 1,7-bisphosphate phosphatase
VEIEYSAAPAEVETTERLRRARSMLDAEFLLLYGDNYWPMRLPVMWRQYVDSQAAALVTVYSNSDGYSRGGIRCDADSYVSEVDPLRNGGDQSGVEIGYAILRRDLINLLPDRDGPFGPPLYGLLADRRQLLAHVTHHRYYGVGCPRRRQPTERFLDPARRTVLLDRDGVLNVKPPARRYVRSWSEFAWRRGALGGLRMLTEHGFEIFVVTNQPGVAYGHLTRADLDEIHARMCAEAAEAGGEIRGVYACPHSWDEGCECRKPRPGMLFSVQRDHGLDLTRTPMVGDDERDLEAAEAAGSPGFDIRRDGDLLAVAKRLVGLGDRFREVDRAVY